MSVRIQIGGRKHTLSAKQEARLREIFRVSERSPEAQEQEREELAPSPRFTGPQIGDLVAGAMPKHCRVIVSRIDHFDPDGEARGARGEHLGYVNRRDASGARKNTLLVSLVSGNLSENLREAFPNLANPARPGRFVPVHSPI